MTTVSDLNALIDRVVAERDLSPSRVRQLRWVAGELGVALEHPDFPPVRSLSGFLREDRIESYLELAEGGQLRRRAASGRGTASTASMRVRRDCLRLLAGAAGIRVSIPDRFAAPELKATVPAARQRRWRGLLATQVERVQAPAGRLRMLAILGVVLDTGARAGELTALTLDDLPEDLSTLRIERRPQARSASPTQVEDVPLSGPTRAALRRWLPVRAELVAALRGSTRALWVSLRPNHAGLPGSDGDAVPRPPGIPLQARGLARAYTRAVDEANLLLADTPGWSPLPRRLEQLRRAVTTRADEGHD
jgi:integrase